MAIETGRHRNIPEELRLCKVCQKSYVENEFHFVCICEAYLDERRLLYNIVQKYDTNFAAKCDEDKFKLLMTEHQHIVINFVYKAWKTHKHILYNM